MTLQWRLLKNAATQTKDKQAVVNIKKKKKKKPLIKKKKKKKKRTERLGHKGQRCAPASRLKSVPVTGFVQQSGKNNDLKNNHYLFPK